ncbi:MAG: ATP-binding protein [Xenococcaceae cyanobacterium MO_167.B52]|nr:ATP-binding protein [Xenococcaceae cyanobacterium MO_167.B52]
MPTHNKRFYNNQTQVSLRTTLTRLSIGITILMMSGLAYFSYRSARNLILEALKQAALVEVQQGVDEIDQWLAVRKAEVDSIANSPSLKAMDCNIAIPYLEGEIKRLDDFYHFALVHPDGEYYVTNLGKAKANVGDRPHIKQGLKGEIVVSNPVISRVQGFPVVIIVAPIWSEIDKTREVVGLNTGVIDIKRLIEVVNGLGYGTGSYAFALNSEGIPIVHPETRRMGTLEKPAPSLLEDEQPDLRQVARQMISGISDINRAIIDDQEVYVAQIPLKQADWFIALVIPRANIESQLHPLDLMVLTIVGLASAIIILLWRIQEFEKAQLAKSQAVANAANQAKSNFLATISHELRTPLHAILGFSRILSEHPGVQAGKKEIDIIRRSGDHLLELINDVLTMSKIEAGHIALHNYDFDLFELLTTLQDMLQLRADAKGLNLNFEIAEDVPQYIHGDSQKLRQVLLNLVSNAIKFTTQGYVNLRVSTCCKLLSPSKSSISNPVPVDCLSLQIEDTGAGIAFEEIPLLFQPFSQTKTGIKTKEGTGLGLAISQRLVQMMGGEIQVSSMVGQGSIFSFEITLIPVDSKQIQTKHSIRPVLGLAEGQPEYRILVVDDRSTNRELMRRTLEPVGFEVRDANNGQEAISIWQSWSPHLIWMDMRMPVMNGYQATEAIRAAEIAAGTTNRTLIIALTASAFEENKDNILAVGCDDLVRKPFVPETLFSLMAQYLGIKYLYDHSFKSIEQIETIANLNLEDLPVGWLERLYQLAYEADGQGIQALIEELPPDQNNWTITLSKWIDDFRFDAIIDLIMDLDPNYDQHSRSEKPSRR